MTQRKIKVRTGRSDTGLSFGILFGSLFGNKRSVNKLKQRMFANNRRNYTRFREVWMCDICNDSYKEDTGTFFDVSAFFSLSIYLSTSKLF
jgi:hypothetical protein